MTLSMAKSPFQLWVEKVTLNHLVVDGLPLKHTQMPACMDDLPSHVPLNVTVVHLSCR